MTLPRYYTTEELAHIIGRSIDTVRIMRQRGTGPRGTKIGRRVMYREDRVAEWLAHLDDAAR